MNESESIILEQIVEDFIIHTITYLKTLDEKELKKQSISFNTYRIQCKIEEGSPETNQMSWTYPEVYSLSYLSIRNLLSQYIVNKNNHENLQNLEKIKAIRKNEFQLLNPDNTLFGFIITRYFEELYKTKSKNLIDTIKSVDYDNVLFKVIFNEVLRYEMKNEVEVDFYYIITGSTLKGRDVLFTSKPKSQLVVPDNIKREKLIDKFRFRGATLWGFGYTKNHIDSLLFCSGWISGNLKIKKPAIKKGNSTLEGLSTLEDLKLKNTNLFSNLHIEEALCLLSGEKIDVKYVSFQNENHFRQFSIDVTPYGVFYSSGTGFLTYPYWMSRDHSQTSKLRNKEIFEIDDSRLHFLQLYPLFRSKIQKESNEDIVLTRFMRLIKFSDPKDSILESCIIFEMLITSDPKELGFQLRTKLPWLLALNDEEKKIIQNIVKRIYDIRSNIVHEGGIKVKNIAKKRFGGAKQASNIAKKMVRLIILRILKVNENKMEITPRKELVNLLDDLLLGIERDLPLNLYFIRESKLFFDEIKEMNLNL